jgi:hypothetical protein
LPLRYLFLGNGGKGKVNRALFEGAVMLPPGKGGSVLRLRGGDGLEYALLFNLTT